MQGFSVPYRDALITSADEAVQFLKKEIAASGVAEFECKNTPSEEHFAVLKAFVPDATDPNKSKPILGLYMGHRPEKNLCFLDAIGVHGEHKGTGLGGAVMKAALGIMHGASAPVLLLRDVIEDGASFWSYYGAVPVKEPVELAARIRTKLYDSSVKLSQHDRKIFELAQEIAQESSFQGWRALSQADELSADGKKVRHEVFNSFCETIVPGGKLHEAMVLFPAEGSTRTILEKRLGKVPVFLRPAGQEPYDIEESLSKAPAISVELVPVRETSICNATPLVQRHI
jgi:hypothetical protein